jgi:hypothetical protein
LNHPNIAHIYGVEDGALVMELVERAMSRRGRAMGEATEGARTNAALATKLGIAAGSPSITTERLWRCFDTVGSTALAASIESVAVIKRPARRGIPPMVENGVVVMPIETPVVPPQP